MKTSDAGIAFIKRAEGFSPVLYLDAGHPCIGYGCDLSVEDSKQYEGRKITADEADALLRERVRPIEDALNSLVEVMQTQSQFDALVDFCYNEGIGAFTRSTLLQKLNECDFKGAEMELGRWVYSEGHVNTGLGARRKAEIAMFRGDF